MLLLLSTVLSAAPWIDPGDMRMRHSLQVLADQGEVNTPLNTWPVMWAGVSLAGQRSNPGTAAERAYVRFEQDRFARPGWTGEFTVAAANQPRLVRDFNDQTREEGELGLTAQFTGQSWAFGLSGQVTDEPADGREWRADGSFLAFTSDQWTLGAGAIDRWWGPGWQSSLMLSSNARPVPSVWLNRTNPGASEHPLLAWLGPWQFTVLLGQLESAREVPEARLVAMRFNFRPLSGLELGLSRMLMYGGGDQPQNGSSLFRALTLSEDSDRTGEGMHSQQAGFDFRYGTALGSVTGGLYGEAVGQVGEDQSLGRFIGLAGVDMAYNWGAASQRWFLEYSDTTAGNIVGRGRDNIAYEDAAYTSGDRFRGRALGSTFDSDALALTLGLQHYFADGRNLALSVSRVKLNRSDNIVASMPSRNVDLAIAREATDAVLANARYEYPLWSGWATLDGQWSSRTIDTATADGSGRAQGSLSAGWRYRF